MQNDTSKLFLIDGMSLLFRSFFAMTRAGLTSPDGTPTGAIYGFMKILIKILKEQNPSHFAVTWDRKEKNFRHDNYAEYKGNRSETPDELIIQIPLIQKLLVDFGVPSYSLAGYESDDLIGTMSTQLCKNCDVYIVSSDKDFMQLVNDQIKIFSLKAGDDYQVLGRDNVIDYFGVPPEKVIEVLALTGDKADNVPGVKGIGEKGAAKLILEFGTVAGIYENIDKIGNPRIKRMLLESRASAFLSHELVTIHREVPIDFTLDGLRFTLQDFLDNPHVRPKLNALNMGSIVRTLYGTKGSWPNVPATAATAAAKKEKKPPLLDLFGNAIPGSEDEANEKIEGAGSLTPTRAMADWGERKYEVVLTHAKLNELCLKISSPDTPCFAFDTETTGLDFIEHRPIGISLSFEPRTGFYIPAHPQHLEGGALTANLGPAEFTEAEVFAKINDAFSRRTAIAVAHNLKFDLHQLHNMGVHLGSGPIACTMVAAWLLDPVAGRYGLDAQTLKNFDLQKIPTSKLIGKEAGRATMLDVPLDVITEYASEDVDATLRLWLLFSEKLKADNLESLFFTMEMPLLRVLADMERRGVHIDSNYLADYAGEVQLRINEIEQQVFIAAGEQFNIGSPKQLGAVLFERLKVHEELGFKGKLARTTLGFKTDAGVLEQFETHPVVALVQEYRELSKLLNTYILVLPQLIKKSTGRIHTSFHQIGTATGRLSSSDPNLQNIPIRTPLGKKVRKAFTAESSNDCIISADYSQIELRVLAHLSSDEAMVAAFTSGADIHRETAAKILGKSPQEVTSEERSNAKTINFGIIYGMGAQRLARQEKISLAQAKSFIEKYFMNFARIRTYLDSQKVIAREEGRVKTHFGRPRPVPLATAVNPMEIKAFENIAINSPIQGTAADIMKLGMLRAHEALERGKFKTRVVLQVHDELVLEGPREECERVEQLIREALQGAVQFAIPLLVEVSHGENWLEAK